MKQQEGAKSKRNYQEGAGAHWKTQMTHQGGMQVRDIEGLGDMGAKEEELDPQGGMELLDP